MWGAAKGHDLYVNCFSALITGLIHNCRSDILKKAAALETLEYEIRRTGTYMCIENTGTYMPWTLIRAL